MTINTIYHGSNRVRGEKILKNKKLKLSRGTRHWLGDGVYFFTEGFYSYKWIVDMFKRKFTDENLTYYKLNKHYLILKGKMEVKEERVFDLTKSEHKVIFDMVLKEIKNKRKAPDDAMPEGIVLNYMFEELQYKEKFDIVKALFIFNKSKYNFKNRLGYMPQEQICIKNKEVVKNIKEYDFKEKIESYDFIMHNMYYDNITVRSFAYNSSKWR